MPSPLCATTSLPSRPSSSPLSRPRVTSVNTLSVPPSPKRPRQTPSPSASRSTTAGPSSGSKLPSASSSSTRTRSRPQRPTLADKRAVTFDRHVTTSPYRGPEYSNTDCRLARRRELSVPLLSQSLSHFSLTHTSPPTPNRQHGASLRMMTELYPSHPPETAKTPRHSSRHHDSAVGPPLPSELSYPSTAPLPHAASFLGSPFSSKTARGQYRFSASDESPSRGHGAAMTERIPQGTFGKQLDWMHGREWAADAVADGEVEEEGKEELSPIQATRQQRTRRDTSGSSSSTTSMDDYSCSGTSSASLLSLGRSSEDHRVRPGVMIWGEQNIEEEETRPETPRHQLFVPTSESDDALQMSLGSKAKKATPSPVLSGGKGRLPQISPLQQLVNRSVSSKSVTPTETRPPSKPRKSPFANFMPRLMSVRRPTLSRKDSLSASARNDEDEATDTEDASSPCNRSQNPSSSTVCDSPTTRVGPQGTLVGLGISSADKADSSFSSESSIEIASPSKPPSGRNSRTHLSTLILSPGPLPRSASARRKTVVAADVPAIEKPAASATTLERAKPLRPLLRRGVTEPRAQPGLSARLLGPESAHTPPAALFDDIKPSPAAFASTGLVKKKSGLPILSIPKFGLKSSPAGSVWSGTTSSQPSQGHRTESSIDRIPSAKLGHGAPPAGQGVPRSRGLRRKTSTMFTASGSSGSFAELKGLSPVTPTKPILHITPFSQGVHTPQPATPTSYYPFATSSSLLSISTPTSAPVQPGTSPTETMMLSSQAVPARMREHRGPVARASNPMLVSAYKAGEKAAESQKDRSTQNRLDRDFVLVQSLGAGAFSQVWKVKDKKEGKLWAVKAGKPYTGVKSRLRQLEEVSILHSLSLNPNPHIIHYVDSWEHRNRLYLRTELAECGDLSRFLNALGDTGGLGEIRCWKLLSELASALQHVHSHNILHLDVKPSNVLITRSGSLKLADFGMSTISDPTGRAADLSPALPVLGVDGEFVWTDSSDDETEGKAGERRIETVPSPIIDREVEGDREYLCPEALEDGSVGREADVFSLGIMVLEAVLNVVLPSNGDGWVKLRNDDFTDLAEHYVPRLKGDQRQVTDEGLPVVSERMLEVVRGMMRMSREGRWRLKDVMQLGEMRRVKEAMENRRLGAACVEEDVEMMGMILDY